MFISPNILLTRLFLKYPELGDAQICRYATAPIKGIKMLPMLREELFPDYLYVCNEAHPIFREGVPAGIALLCASGDDRATFENGNTVILRTKRELAFILNELQEIYMYFRDWERTLDMALISGCSIQDLLELSKDVIGDPIIVYDPSLKLLAIVGEPSRDNEVFWEVKEKGFLPSNRVDELVKQDVFKRLYSEGETFFLSYMNAFDSVKMLRVNGHPAAHCALPHLSHINYEYSEQLFDLLCGKIQNWLDSDQANHVAKKYMYEYLIFDLLDDVPMSDGELETRMRYIGLPVNANFQLLAVDFGIGSHAPNEYLAAAVNNTMIKARVFTYRERLYILLVLPENIEEARLETGKRLDILATVLKGNVNACGVSRIFETLPELRNAIRQADACRTFRGKCNVPAQNDLYCFYDDISFYHILMMCSEKVPLESLCSSKLLTALNDDNDRQTQYTQLIAAYLDTGCEISKTAAAAHMTRNNVIYHFRRLNEKYGIDLNDPKQRFDMAVTLKILEFTKKIYN